MRRFNEAVDDEWYTYYEDIKNEMYKFKDYLKGRVIYCSCDLDYSNFVKFFKDCFDEFGLKKLCWSHINYDVIKEYDGSVINEIPVISGDCRNYLIINYCYDNNAIIITNPPFSLSRLYIKDLIDANLDYIMIYPLLNFNNKIVPHLYFQNKIKLGGRVCNFFNNGLIKSVNCVWINSFKMLFDLKDYKYCVLSDLIEGKDYRLFITYDGEKILQLKRSKFPIDFNGKICLLTNWAEFKKIRGYDYHVFRDLKPDRIIDEQIYGSVCVIKKGGNNEFS